MVAIWRYVCAQEKRLGGPPDNSPALPAPGTLEKIDGVWALQLGLSTFPQLESQFV